MPPPYAQNRRQIIRAFKTRRGWALQPAALPGIEAYLHNSYSTDDDDDNDDSNNDDSLDRLCKMLDPHMQGKNTVTASVVEASLGLDEESDDDDDDLNLIRQPQRRTGSSSNSSSRQPLSTVQQRNSRSHDDRAVYKQPSSTSHRSKGPFHEDNLTVVSAFECPKLVYHNLRKQFQVEEKKWSLFGTAEDKVDMLAQRYALVHQRILRHDLFRPSDLGRQLQRGNNNGGGGGPGSHKLTPVESLLGRRSGSSTAAPLLLLGMLVQLDEGQYFLEDPTGQVPVSFAELADATTNDNDDFFVTERAILLVEGTARDGIFYIHRLGHPLLEERQTSLQAIQQQVHHPAYPIMPRHHHNSSLTSSLTSSSSFIVLSDVHLDQPQVLQRLEGLFASYENYSPHRLPLFCLMGNFTSSFSSQGRGAGGGASSSGITFRQSMEELAAVVNKFPNLAEHAHWVIIPGPRDQQDAGARALLPMPPPTAKVAPIFTKAGLHHVHVSSNPCRVRWEGREIVFFRYDLLQLLQHEQLSFGTEKSSNDRMEVDDDDGDNEDGHRLPHCRLIKTILDQGHLVPVAGVPIYWQYDHALRLYPLPDVLVLGLDPRPGDDNESGSFDEIYGDCQVLHPGSVAATTNPSYATIDMTPTAKSATSKNRRNRNNNDSSDDSSDEDEDEEDVDTRIEYFPGVIGGKI